MESKRTDLKRRIALWLCPELGQELKASAEAHDSSQKAMIALHKRLSDTEKGLAKAEKERRVEEFRKDEANMKAHAAEDECKTLSKRLESLEKKYKRLVRTHLVTKGLYDQARIQLDKAYSKQSKARHYNG